MNEFGFLRRFLGNSPAAPAATAWLAGAGAKANVAMGL